MRERAASEPMDDGTPARGPVAAPNPAGPVVETVTDPDRLRALAPEWEALASEAGLDHPFLTHEWVEAWWEAFGAGRDLHVLVVRDAGRTIAIAPLMRGRIRICGLPVASLESIGNEHTPRGGFLVAPERRDAFAVLWDRLFRRGRPFKVVVLRQLPGASETLVTMQGLAARAGWLVGRWRSAESPWLRVAGTDFPAYYETLSSRFRAHLRNKERRARKIGDLEVETVTGEADLEAALADGLRIEASGWKGKAGSAIQSEAATLRFYTLLARRAARRDWLRLNFLRVGGRGIAFNYTLRYARRRFVLKSGYDADCASLSPSSLLVRNILERVFERGDEEYDFLGDRDPWKVSWTGTARPHDWLYLMPPSLPLRLLHAAKFQLVPRLRLSPVFRRALGAHRDGGHAAGRGGEDGADRDGARAERRDV